MNPALVAQFAELFKGRNDAWGTGKGAVIRGALSEAHYKSHLEGHAPGLGIFPLLDSGEVHFAAVDLDEPDFEAAHAITELLPGWSWIEESRSGNYHVWAFFDRPIEAYIPRGIMKLACEGAGKPNAEIFPKQDRLLPGMVGNYINLPYHGDDRPILQQDDRKLTTEHFIHQARDSRARADVWEIRAQRLSIKPREQQGEGREQGTAAKLHVCAEKIIRESLSDRNPIGVGHRHVVLFNLAKMLLDWKQLDDDEAWMYLREVNNHAAVPLQTKELGRIFNNARRGGYTSTGCDSPVMSPYVSSRCPIASG